MLRRCLIQMNKTRANGNKEDVATVRTHRQTEREIQEGTGTLATSWPLPPSSSSPSSSLSGQRASGQAAPSRPSICAPPLLPLRRRTFTIRMVLPPSPRRKIDGEQGFHSFRLFVENERGLRHSISSRSSLSRSIQSEATTCGFWREIERKKMSDRFGVYPTRLVILVARICLVCSTFIDI